MTMSPWHAVVLDLKSSQCRSVPIHDLKPFYLRKTSKESDIATAIEELARNDTDAHQPTSWNPYDADERHIHDQEPPMEEQSIDNIGGTATVSQPEDGLAPLETYNYLPPASPDVIHDYMDLDGSRDAPLIGQPRTTIPTRRKQALPIVNPPTDNYGDPQPQNDQNEPDSGASTPAHYTTSDIINHCNNVSGVSSTPLVHLHQDARAQNDEGLEPIEEEDTPEQEEDAGSAGTQTDAAPDPNGTFTSALDASFGASDPLQPEGAETPQTIQTDSDPPATTAPATAEGQGIAGRLRDRRNISKPERYLALQDIRHFPPLPSKEGGM